ncbi:DUF4234 domain-containing protein [Methanopyrus kandleri]|uniref:Uncharacterized membrane protein specific for M.kandleri, MK-4 family n=2 Tax=Methanopyrus kandleri TaxID=2320 RepID=Q8TWD1_METKA|nr:DUF4234 domain-containing protein [Methanopyrus kandleri]AAM02317.1 Uncharacterized membrane protein specific for M.kandleri, MK-4 family [Methanopyrus kandleri AV19]HII69737.1 DUF4234 domain-containing protein [Methanopyrus kandleri]
MDPEIALQGLREHSTVYGEEDRIVPVWFAFFPQVLTFLGWLTIVMAKTFPGHATFLVLLGLLEALIGYPLAVYLMYLMIKRRNEHVTRSLGFLRYLVELLAGVGYDVDILRSELEEMRLHTERRNPVIYALLTLVPPIGWLVALYIYHFLNRDLHEHSVRERDFLESVARLLDMNPHEPPFELETFYVVPRRSTFLYFVLTLLTAGIFALYWWYTVVQDPNRHFRAHRRLERDLIESIEQAFSD